MKEEWEVSILLALFLFIFAGRIKRGLTQIFAKKNRIKQSAIIRDNLRLAKKQQV